MWAIALMLDTAIKEIDGFEKYYSYKNFTILQKLIKIMEKTKFEGASVSTTQSGNYLLTLSCIML